MSPEQIRVLLVEDSPTYAQMTRAVLAREQAFAVEQVASLQDAFDSLRSCPADVVLLDLTLPDAEGIDTYRRLAEESPEVPIVILTGLNDESLALQAVQEGAQDYLRKRQEDLSLLGRALRYAMERHRMQAHLKALAMIDELTGLYNRRGFLSIGEHDIARIARTGRPAVLVFADLDGLKQINDELGHIEGDRAIKDAAEVLRSTYRRSDVVARVGGDEFAVLGGDIDASHIHRLEEAVELHNATHDRPYRLSLSAGWVPCAPDSAESLTSMMDAADARMYAAKRSKRVARAG